VAGVDLCEEGVKNSRLTHMHSHGAARWDAAWALAYPVGIAICRQTRVNGKLL
jgi:hypothetical protein